MKFNEAMYALESERKVLKSTWDNDYFWFKKNDNIFWGRDNGDEGRVSNFVFYTELLKDDWEIVPDFYKPDKPKSFGFGKAMKLAVKGHKVKMLSWSEGCYVCGEGSAYLVYYNITDKEARTRYKAHNVEIESKWEKVK